MYTFESCARFAVLDLHSVEDATDVGFDNRGGFGCRRRHTTSRAISTIIRLEEK